MSIQKPIQNIINLIVSIQLNKQEGHLYLQLANHIEALIASNTIEKGNRLPPIRTLAQELQVNPVTVVKAYSELSQRNLVHTIQGSGVYVGHKELVETPTGLDHDEIYSEPESAQRKSPEIIIPPNALNFATSTPSTNLFPVASFTTSLNAVLERDGGKVFAYDESNGYGPLRETARKLLLDRYAIQVSARNVQIISGAQQGIDIVAKAMLKSGDTVLVEDPTYTGAIAVFASRGARIIPIPIKASGLDIAELKRCMEQYRPKLFYCMPDFQNPTAKSLSTDQRKEIIVAARHFNCHVIEDDYVSDLRYDNGPGPMRMKSLDDPENGRVIYIKSFSKILMPGLRVGFLAAPVDIHAKMLQAKHLSDISSSGLIQRSFDHYLRSGSWEHHLEFMIEEFRNRYRACCSTLTALEQHGCIIDKPGGGLHFWITLPSGTSANTLYQRAAARGVVCTPGNVFTVDANNHDDCLRISIAELTSEEIIRGMAVLADLMEDHGEMIRPMV